MKINYDCIREILLCLEKELTLDDELRMSKAFLEHLVEYETLQNFTKQDIAYSIKMLDESGLIDASIKYADGRVMYHVVIYDITYDGHVFLNNIKPQNNWNKIKSKLSFLGTASIPIINEIACKLISQNLGL